VASTSPGPSGEATAMGVATPALPPTAAQMEAEIGRRVSGAQAEWSASQRQALDASAKEAPLEKEGGNKHSLSEAQKFVDEYGSGSFDSIAVS
jgi:hypothetical protein